MKILSKYISSLSFGFFEGTQKKKKKKKKATN